jgi:hypothetical protein
MLAGVLLAVVLSLSVAGVASAQTSAPTGGTGASTTTTTIKAAGSTTARTGAEMWIPLVLGGGVIGIALAARTLARARSIT